MKPIKVDIIIRDEGYYLTFVFNTYKSMKRLEKTRHYKFLDERMNSLHAHPDYHVELIEWMDAQGLTSKLV